MPELSDKLLTHLAKKYLDKIIWPKQTALAASLCKVYSRWTENYDNEGQKISLSQC